ncbi:MAG: nucleotide exchange factor GrpE [Muribaculaceae bacterium]|nr:nucleotide exchange factor GrpE [Muribaculaceae bacterium]
MEKEKKDIEIKDAEREVTQDATEEQEVKEAPATEEVAEEANEATAEDKISELEAQLKEKDKEYLFLAADFQNYRKRTLQEKQDLIKNGARDALLRLLPVVDDFERALKAMEESTTDDAQLEGVKLIYNKFMKYLKDENVTPIESTGKEFDVELHDAVTTFPAADESQKGKVIDTVLTGYLINDKVLRHAKVVVGQ